MSKQQLNFQDTFLNQVRKESQEIKVVMMNGASIIGVVKGFDNFTIMLQSRNSQHLLYKHAIAQMISRRSDIRKPADSNSEADHSDTTPSPAPEKSAPTNRDDVRHRDKKDTFNKIDLSSLTASADNSKH